jgi:hypothetical protein
MKRIVSGLISLSIVSIALFCLQAALTQQRNAFALNLTDTLSTTSRVISPGDPITPTSYFTSYLPIISRPEAFVAGHIADNGAPVASVMISTTVGRTTTTDANGNFQLHLPNGSHTLTPILAGYVFSPTARVVDVSADTSGLDFEATPPPCAAGASVFFDNFSNTNSGWGEQNIAPWYRHYTNGEYEASLYVNTELFHAAPGVAPRSGNFVVSADMRQTDAPEYSDMYGLWIGSVSAGKYYMFAVATNVMFGTQSNYGVGYYDSTAPIWLGKGYGVSSAINMGNGVNTLRVHRCGSRYYFYANDALLIAPILPELANQSLTAGYYARTSHNATYRLDNFRVQTAP